MHGANATKLVKSWRKNEAFKNDNGWFGHLDVKHALKNMMSGMILSKILCPMSLSIYERCIEGQQLRFHCASLILKVISILEKMDNCMGDVDLLYILRYGKYRHFRIKV